MKPAFSHLRLHQQVWALVEEVLANNEAIISFNGDLIRVWNQTGSVLKPGQRVLTTVQEINPLKLKLISPRASFPNSLDVQV